MKTLRLCLVVLLAVLLPIRGAVAAAMLCSADASDNAPAALAACADGHHLHGGHAMHGADMPMQADHGSGTPADGANAAPHGTHSTACPICMSGWCMALMSAVLPRLAMAPLTAAADFAALHAPIPTFQSDGPDRPPRSF